ncbi:L-serine ammonia-lyase, iron-sulfur-dependent, subunit alpha [Kocuria rhizophila]|nr:L-serine ammonia-lyase, iron-sulfur-dependent, subunit alpha [Kocuria rhizophila]
MLHFYTRFMEDACDGRIGGLPAHRGGHRHRDQGERLDLRCRGGLGEVAPRAAVAAAGLCACCGRQRPPGGVRRGSGHQHNAGLTCDPSAAGADPCISATRSPASRPSTPRLSMQGTPGQGLPGPGGQTMRETGADMKIKCEETCAAAWP